MEKQLCTILRVDQFFFPLNSKQKLDEINQYERFGGGCFNDDKFIDIDDIIERIQVYITEKFV